MHHVRRKSKHCPIMWLPLKAASRCAFFRALKEDLHETVFLVLDEGLTLDLAEVKFVEATEDTEARVEFHFPREVGGIPRSIRNRKRSNFTAELRPRLRVLVDKTHCPSGPNFILAPCAPMARPTCDRIQIRFLPSHIVLHY